MHHVVLDCDDNTFTCLDEDRKKRTVKGIPRPIFIREIASSYVPTSTISNTCSDTSLIVAFIYSVACS